MTKTLFCAQSDTQKHDVLRNPDFKTRNELRRNILRNLQELGASHSPESDAASKLLAQRLAFVPTLHRPFGPYQGELEELAKNLLAGYEAYYDAYTEEDFPAPGEAALESLKALEFNL